MTFQQMDKHIFMPGHCPEIPECPEIHSVPNSLCSKSNCPEIF